MTYWVAGAAAVGALMDKKHPLRGAAMGAGGMMTGGALFGGMGAAGAAGGAAAGEAAGGAAAAGGATASGGGLLGGGTIANGGSGLFAASTATPEGAALTSQLTAEQIAAQSSPGLLSEAGSTLKQAQPFMSAANTGLSVAKQFRPTPYQAPPAMALQQKPLNMQGLLGDQEMQQTMDMQAKRRALMQQYGRIA
jgi:hypothetical protein